MSAFARPLDARAPDATARAEKALESSLWKSLIKSSGIFGKDSGWAGLAADAFSEAVAEAVGETGPSLLSVGGTLGVVRPRAGAGNLPSFTLPPAASGVVQGTEAIATHLDVAAIATHLDLAAIADVRSLVDVSGGGRARISSRYGPRADPLGTGRRQHNGVDLAAPAGSAIRAAADGVVSWAGPRGGYGNLVEIRHADGTRTRYAHARALHVKKGQKIQQGEVIAEVGATGRATGPHLHFEVRTKNAAINPEHALKAYTRRVDSLSKHRSSAAGEP